VLTTYYLRGAIPERQLYLCDIGSYREQAIACRFGRAAVELDAARQRVVLDDGTGIAYDKLLIATGSSPRRFDGDVPPEVAAEVCYLRTIADAQRIRAKALSARHVVVIGGGLVGLQVAGALARPALTVSCVVSSRQLLSQNVDAACAELLRDHVARSASIAFHFGANVTRIAGGGGGYRVDLDSGAELTADLVVVGKGVSPTIAFVDRAQVAVKEGILVDECMRTSCENVWAAGDLAQGADRLTGRRRLVPNWINACAQGSIAGADMAGAEVAFRGSLPENITTLFGMPVASIGITRRRDGDGLREVTSADEARGTYRRLVLRGDVLVGAVLLRDVADAGVIRDVIAAGDEERRSALTTARGRFTQGERLRACLSGTLRG
jgi:NAD(P)H-nitrite reductase large subunit